MQFLLFSALAPFLELPCHRGCLTVQIMLPATDNETIGSTEARMQTHVQNLAEICTVTICQLK